MIDLAPIEYTINAHANYAKKSSKAFRKWDAKTPYWSHPLWCAMTIISETNLDGKTKDEGFLTLLYHDILEDTTKKLPEGTSSRIEYLVQQMTFEAGNAQEMLEIWIKPPEIRLYKLYDKVSNLLDGSWMDKEKKKKYKEYSKQLCIDVKENYGELNITQIAHAIFNNPD